MTQRGRETLAAMALLLLAGCDGCKGGEETGCTSYVDADGDGWTLCDDCDDADPAVHPEATDCANGLDDDCDGEVDPAGAPDPGTWHPDADGDGFGDYAGTVQACDQPADAVDDATDCDDAEAEVNPAAEETCNERDDDCDGLVDEDAVDMGIWYTDEDGDGWGVAGTEIEACEPPSGTAGQAGDCDDADVEAHPKATPGCDQRDLDCDGAIDNDADLDGWSDEACGGGDCDDGDTSVYPGAEEICEDGVVNDCDATMAEAIVLCFEDLYLEDDSLATIEGGMDDADCGRTVVGEADLNADGWSDVLVGAPGWGTDESGTNVGFVGLFHGPISGTLALSDADTSIRGEVGGPWGDFTGQGLAVPGDVNGDGHDDLLLGAGDAGGRSMGAAYLFYGPISGSLTLSQASAVFTGVPWGGDVDEAVSGAGDVNGDGYTDLIIGDDQQGSYPPCGEAYVVFGPVSGLSSLEDAEVVLSGANQGDHAGYAVASAGDVDGDGLDDVLVGAYLHGEEDTKEEDRGMVHLLVSPVEGELSLGDAAASMVGETMFGQAGACLAGAGDLDDDGLADFLIGAPKEDAADTERLGRAYAVLGVPSGVVSLASAEIRILGAMENDRTGSSVAGSGDVDGDGALDIIIGAEYAYEGSSTVGGAFIILAPEPGSYDLADPDIRLVGSAGYAGAAVDGAGDMDGDGREEVLIGAPASDASANDAGTVYLVSIPITY